VAAAPHFTQIGVAMSAGRAAARTRRIRSVYQMNPKEPTTNAWYAISVRYKFERQVSTALAGKGYE
jgi:hypothetical protein